ncbi:hypothetical protein ACET3Z_028149 [Daucus carota]
MGDNKVLRFFWRASVIEVKVDVDKCNIMDVVIDYEDEAKKRGVKLDYAFPTFRYAFTTDKRELILLLIKSGQQQKGDIDVGI